MKIIILLLSLFLSINSFTQDDLTNVINVLDDWEVTNDELLSLKCGDLYHIEPNIKATICLLYGFENIIVIRNDETSLTSCVIYTTFNKDKEGLDYFNQKVLNFLNGRYGVSEKMVWSVGDFFIKIENVLYPNEYNQYKIILYK